MTSKYAGKSGSFAAQIQAFADQANVAIDATLRDVVIRLGSSLITMSPVGDPEIWAENVAFRGKNKAEADAYDANVEVRNVVKALTPGNFTRNGNLKRGVKYAKPLTKAERVQNFNVNGLVSGKGYVGGRFRNNWMFSIGIPDSTTTEAVDPSGSKSMARIVDGSIEFKAGTRAFITNSLPYAIALEYGHSTQSPDGMVRVTLARFQQIVMDAIERNKL
jgi:hypothetical protein